MHQLFSKIKGFSSLPLMCFVVISTIGKAQFINRFDLVNRHNVILKEIDPLAPLSFGNGDFAYTADTGMQSLEQYYYKNGIPVETLSTWAWHSFPDTKNLKLEDAMKASDFHGRKIMYASQEKTAAGEYFRQNPHPAPLGQISLVRGNGNSLEINDISKVNQKLDLWKGLISSAYEIDGKKVEVETVSSQDESTVAPLRKWKVGEGHQLAVVGLGGLGHMAVKFGVAFGAEVTVLSTSEEKRQAAKDLGAHNFVVTTNSEELEKVGSKFDFILDTVSAPHDLNMYLALLKTDGVHICVGNTE